MKAKIEVAARCASIAALAASPSASYFPVDKHTRVPELEDAVTEKVAVQRAESPDGSRQLRASVQWDVWSVRILPDARKTADVICDGQGALAASDSGRCIC